MKERRPAYQSVAIWAGITLALVALSFIVPDSWFDRVKQTYDVEDRTPFSALAIEAEIKMDGQESVSVDLESTELWVSVGIRKLLRVGKLNEIEMEKARVIFTEAFAKLRKSPDHKTTISENTAEAMSKALPRIESKRVEETVRTFLDMLTFSNSKKATAVTPEGPGVGPIVNPKQPCVDCHNQTRLLPGDRTFDAIGIYPGNDPGRFKDGRAMPTLNEYAEIDSAKKLFGAESLKKSQCAECHSGHSETSSALMKRRRDNLGFWLNLDADPIPGMIDVEVKLKTFDSAHRVPGGLASRAYVIKVTATADDKPLRMWYGPRLPTSLGAAPGVYFAKVMIDKNGNVTHDENRAVDLRDDLRLQHGRFSVDHFLFRTPEQATISVRAELFYLPKFPLWADAELVTKLEKKR